MSNKEKTELVVEVEGNSTEPRNLTDPKRVVIDKTSYKLGEKLYVCDVLTGVVQVAQLHKGFVMKKHKKVKVLFVYATDNLFFLKAKGLKDAGEKFTIYFENKDYEVRKELERRGETLQEEE